MPAVSAWDVPSQISFCPYDPPHVHAELERGGPDKKVLYPYGVPSRWSSNFS